MGDIVRFDKFHRLKRKLPGFGKPGFTNAYAEARAFVHTAEGNFLNPTQLKHLLSKLSPFGLCIVLELVEHMHIRRDSASHER